MNKQPINRITEDDFQAFGAKPTLDNYQHIAGKSAIYPGQGTPLGLIYVALKLNGEAGEFAEHVGKAMRDDGFASEDERVYLLSKERRMHLLMELGDQLWYLAKAAKELDATLEEVALINLLKLKSRTDRDMLQGSGDDR